MTTINTRIAAAWYQTMGTRFKGRIRIKTVHRRCPASDAVDYFGEWGSWFGQVITREGTYTFSACNRHVTIYRVYPIPTPQYTRCQLSKQ